MPARNRLNPARRQDPTSDGVWLVVLAVLVGLLALLGSGWFGAWLVDPTASGPLSFYVQLFGGDRAYPVFGLLYAAPLVLVLVLLIAAAVWVLRPHHRTRVDPKATSMARPRELEGMIGEAARADATRLGSERASAEGVPLGKLLPGGAMLHASWEWVQIWIMGPRAGKTSCVCVPQITQTRGPVLATTNKRDLVDMCRGPRTRQGNVWIFDPQDIIGEPATWWWNPLSFIKTLADAELLARLFSASARDDNAQTDAYFDVEAENYLATLLLAAAAAKEPITAIYEWITRPGDDTPVAILRMAGHDRPADKLNSIITLTEKQRDGVIGTASKMVTWLTNETLLPWITPTGPDDARPQFDPEAFVRTTQSLFLVSKEGHGTTRAATVALTVATVTAAERLGARSPRGRLPIPMMVVLDEAANVVRWPDLPDLYSHFGSRGIVMSTFLQSWNQGVAVWGRDGMEKLWSAANVRVVGAGIAQADFLNDVSTLIGDHDVIRRDSSTSGRSGRLFDGSGRSVSTRVQRERVFDPDELAALPRGRAVMLSSGAPAALVELVHWTAGPHADEIKASEDYYTSLAVQQTQEAS